jgi:tetratricopeptide (TPR) repeat protein
MTACGRGPNLLLAGWMREADLTRAGLCTAIAKAAADVGLVAEVSSRTVQRWLNDGDIPRPGIRTLVTAALSAHVGERIEPADLGWFEHTASGGKTEDRDHEYNVPTNSAQRVKEGEVLRRELLRLMAAGAGINSASRGTLAHARALMNAALDAGPTPSSLTGWEARAARYGNGYRGQPPAQVLGAAAGDFLAVHAALDRPLTSTARARLCAVAARLAGSVGIIQHDLGESQDADAWFDTAVSAASESENPRLLAWLDARRAMISVNYGSAHDALALTTKAVASAGPEPSPTTALAAAVQARAYARLRQPEQAERSLGRAESILERLDERGAADSWYGYPAHKHWVHASHALTLAGATTKARAAQAQASGLARSTSWMTRALVSLDYAGCVVRDGDPDAAARQAVTTLRELPDDYRSGIVIARAREVYRAIPAQARALPSVHDLHQLI